MVKICSTTYPSSNETKYSNHFAKFPFELSPFQKWSIEAIVDGHHMLTCAHTGSGKTLPAEFAIMHFCNPDPESIHKKKVVYCSPIKALSNQKFYDFCQHPSFQGINIGLITGDIKTNTDADVLIMTTEILLNKLYDQYHKHTLNNQIHSFGLGSLGFDLDIQNDVACVIFDEVHYINDKDRGQIWEQAIMLLPPHIQLVMLSATIEAPEMFAHWCETRQQSTTNQTNLNNQKKEVYLTTTSQRIVPLTHYSFITCTKGIYKLYKKDKDIEAKINSMIDQLHVIQTSKGEFKEKTVDSIKETLTLFDKQNYRPTRQYVMNQVCKHMVENNMFPAICFVYSRKQVEDMAHELQTVILEDDSKVRYTIHTECEQILRKSLSNWKEYVELPEYKFILSLLEKGVAIHHAGLINVFREMIELMFSRGYIKLLFATETFSVGINMPTKTVLFTALSKYDGSNMRALLPHEYNQQSGRAGRRGKDTIGHVIHLTNLWDTNKYSNEELRHILKGNPQTLESKFHVSYPLLLNLIANTDTNTNTKTNSTIHTLAEFAGKTMYQQVIDKQLGAIYQQIQKQEQEIDKQSLAGSLSVSNTPPIILYKWIELEKNMQYADNRSKKNIQKQMHMLKTTHPHVERDLSEFKKSKKQTDEINSLKVSYDSTSKCVQIQIEHTLGILYRRNFIECCATNNANYMLTQKGYIARRMREIHCIAFTEWFLYLDSNSPKESSNHRFQNWTPIQMVGFFSLFTNITVSDEKKKHTLDVSNKQTKEYNQSLLAFEKTMNEIYDEELRMQLQTGMDLCVQYDLVYEIMDWCLCENEMECKTVIQNLEINKGIFLGEFVKAILKINNIVFEMEQIAEYIGDLILLEKLKKIPEMTIKYVCNTQSLYV